MAIPQRLVLMLLSIIASLAPIVLSAPIKSSAARPSKATAFQFDAKKIAGKAASFFKKVPKVVLKGKDKVTENIDVEKLKDASEKAGTVFKIAGGLSSLSKIGLISVPPVVLAVALESFGLEPKKKAVRPDMSLTPVAPNSDGRPLAGPAPDATNNSPAGSV